MVKGVESAQAGLLNRVFPLLDLTKTLPDNLSDEEVEGLLRLLPCDTARSMTSLLRPRYRKEGLFFFKMTSAWLDKARRVRERGGKILLVPFNFPPEIIHCFHNAAAITSEVLSTLAVVALEGQGEPYWDFAISLGLPDHLCSANTIELGSILTERDFRPDAIIQSAPGGCDVNSKVHEFVSSYLNIPQFFLEKPPYSTSRGRSIYSGNFRRLVEEIQQFVGEKLEEERVREVMDKANRCTELYYELWDLHKFVPCPVPNIFALFLYATRFTMWGTDLGVRNLEMMVKRVREIMESNDYPAREERARTLWIYLGYFFDFPGFFDWMEERGISYLGDGLDLCFPSPVDTSSLDSMLEGMAEAAWNMPMTRQVGGDTMWSRWLDDVIYAARDLGANCAVYCGHHSCKQTWSVFSTVRNEIQKRAGIPTLCLQGDSWIRRMTPMTVLQEEISSFVDNVVNRRRRQKKYPVPSAGVASEHYKWSEGATRGNE